MSLPRLLLALALAAAAPARAQQPPADLLLVNGHIVTNDASFGIATAMAVRGERIAALGTDVEIGRLAGPATRRIDLQGRTVLPGLIDSHTHGLEWTRGIVQDDIDLDPSKIGSIAEAVAAVAARVAKAKPGEWIAGQNWDDARLAEKRYLTRADLDPVSPANPVILAHISGHLSVVNGAALKLAGITRETRAPAGGEIERDARGEPTGVLKELATQLVYPLLPPPSMEDEMRAMSLLTREAAQAGLTTIHESAVPFESLPVYEQARRRGLIGIRIQVAPLVRSPADVDRVRALGVHTGSGDAHLRYGPIKMFADGGMGARTIAIHPPAVAGEPKNFGLLAWKTAELQKTQQQLSEMGWQLATHAIGDRALDQVLDSYAKIAARSPGREMRNRVIHAGVSTPAIQQRLAADNVLVDGNPAFVHFIGSWFEKYGPQRVRWSYPAKSYFDRGVRVSGGSDVSVTPISPWWGIWAAVERREVNSGRVLAPEERVSVRQALQMFTLGGAYAGFEEQDKGSLEAGKLADFIVVDRDPFAIPPADLKSVRVLATYVGGKALFERADRIFTHAKIWTADDAQPIAQAFAIGGERILAVGTNEAIGALASPETIVTDLGGKLVVPGFEDAHIHFPGPSVNEVRVDDATNLAELQRVLAEFAAAHPGNPWIVGYGWNYAMFPGRKPHRSQLDAVIADRPVYLSDRDGHVGFANSRALAAAGITRASPNPPNGTIVRDASGDPTGELKEAAQRLMDGHVPMPGADDLYASLLQHMDEAAAQGLTAAQNAHWSPDEHAVFVRAMSASALKLRFRFATPILPNVPPSEGGFPKVHRMAAPLTRADLARYLELRDRFPGPLVKLGAVKGFVDGTVDAKTALMFEPYAGGGGSGLAFWQQNELNDTVALYDREGFQVLLHAIGDRGVNMALNAFEHAARVNGTSGRRHRVEHLEVTRASDLPRFRRLGVIASTQAIFATPDETTLTNYAPALGAERAARANAFKLIDDAGAVQAFGSDWSVFPLSPLLGIYTAVTRTTPQGTPAGGWHPQNRITVEAALRHYTRDAAYSVFDEATRGAIAPGKLADFVVLSQDILTIPPERLLETKVLLTVMGGRETYRSGD